jgi:hypothetical protein
MIIEASNKEPSRPLKPKKSSLTFSGNEEKDSEETSSTTPRDPSKDDPSSVLINRTRTKTLEKKQILTPQAMPYPGWQTSL